MTNQASEKILRSVFGESGTIAFGTWKKPKRTWLDRILRRTDRKTTAVQIGPGVPMRWRYTGNSVENAENIMLTGKQHEANLFSLFAADGKQLTHWQLLSVPISQPGDTVLFAPGAIRLELKQS